LTAMKNGSRWITANGTVSRVTLSGNGDALLVLIHEMGGTLESWDLVAAPLGQHRRILGQRRLELARSIGGRQRPIEQQEEEGAKESTALVT